MKSILPERYVDLKLHQNTRPEAYSNWERNVVDKYKDLSNDQIRSEIEANRFPYAILMTHINIDYNLGAVLRIGNCLGAKVFYYGTKKWDKRGATGVWHYSPITHLKDIESVRALKAEYSFVALEQAVNSVRLHEFTWSSKKKNLIVIGEESSGLQSCPEIFELADHIVEIPQQGSVRSMNAATACAIACYDYSTKMHFNK